MLLLAMFPGIREVPVVIYGSVEIQGANGDRGEARWRLAASSTHLQLVVSSTTVDEPEAALGVAPDRVQVWLHPRGKRNAASYEGADLPAALQDWLDAWATQPLSSEPEASAAATTIGTTRVPDEIHLELRSPCTNERLGDVRLRIRSIEQGRADWIALDAPKTLPLDALMETRAAHRVLRTVPACS